MDINFSIIKQEDELGRSTVMIPPKLIQVISNRMGREPLLGPSDRSEQNKQKPCPYESKFSYIVLSLIWGNVFWKLVANIFTSLLSKSVPVRDYTIAIPLKILVFKGLKHSC